MSDSTTQAQAATAMFLPFGLPSLRIVWVQIPMPLPMTAQDFDALISQLQMCRDALVQGDNTEGRPAP